MEPQKPVDLQPDSEQPRIRTIATEMVSRAVERRRFFAEPLREMDEGKKRSVLRSDRKKSAKDSALLAIDDNSAAGKFP
jgi:hypothetical protein